MRLTYTATAEEGSLNVISLIENHHLSRKVKGHQAWKPAAAECCQCTWPKAEQIHGDTAAPAALLHPGLHPLPPTLSKVSQIPCSNRSTASPTKQQATGIRRLYPFLYPNLLCGFTWQLMQKGCTKGKGMQGTDIANLAQIQPLQATPCTGLFRRAHSSQHSFSSVKLSISMPVCINIFFLQRERRKLPGGSWAGDP